MTWDLQKLFRRHTMCIWALSKVGRGHMRAAGLGCRDDIWEMPTAPALLRRLEGVERKEILPQFKEHSVFSKTSTCHSRFWGTHVLFGQGGKLGRKGIFTRTCGGIGVS